MLPFAVELGVNDTLFFRKASFELWAHGAKRFEVCFLSFTEEVFFIVFAISIALKTMT